MLEKLLGIEMDFAINDAVPGPLLSSGFVFLGKRMA